MATELARKVGAPLRMPYLALADLTEAMNRGWAERECRSVLLLPQERAGVSVKIDMELIRKVLEEDPPAPTDAING